MNAIADQTGGFICMVTEAGKDYLCREHLRYGDQKWRHLPLGSAFYPQDKKLDNNVRISMYTISYWQKQK